MTDDELRRAYAAFRAAAPRTERATPRPSLEELQQLATGETPKDEREELLDRILADPATTRELATLYAVAPKRRAATPWLRPSWIAMAAAAAILIVATPFVLRTRDANRERVFRATAQDAGTVEILQPIEGVPATAGVQLLWRAVPDVEQYTVELVGEDGRTTATIATRDTTLVLPDSISADRYRSASGWMLVARLRDGGQRQSVMRLTTKRAP